MKPILFNTEMVRALLDNRKTMTRRVVKPQPNTKCSHGGEHEFIRDDFIDGSDFTGFICKKCGYGVCGPHFRYPVGTSWIRPPYRPGDILYVRETWCWCPCWDCGMDTEEGCVDEIAERFYNDQKAEWGCYGYKASFAPNEAPFDRWHPSIHMPREAARIFLRGTGVKVPRVQDITDEEAKKEGCKDREDFQRVWNDCYSRPQPVKAHGVITHYESYPWEDIQETRTYRGKPWRVMGNPWVWVIEFERCERPTEGQT